jgi:hypothetical protein
MSKTNVAKTNVVIAQEEKDQESDIIQEYKKLNEQCDYVLEKIVKKKQTRKLKVV